MICPSCGRTVADDSTSCTYCGARIVVPPRRRRPPRSLLVAIAGALVAAILGLGGVCALRALGPGGKAASGGGAASANGSRSDGGNWGSRGDRGAGTDGEGGQGPEAGGSDEGLEGEDAVWTGGLGRADLPPGYTAIANDADFTIGLGKMTILVFSDGGTALSVDLYIINRSDAAIYTVFSDNVMGRRRVGVSEVYVSILRTEPGQCASGAVYIDALHDPADLSSWRGTLYVLDDDSCLSPDVTILGEYRFDLAYVFPASSPERGEFY